MRSRSIRYFVSLLGLLLPLLFTTCFNPIDITREIEIEVKIANDLFLEVESVSPGNNEEDVNPGERLVIEFDRDLDLGTVTDSTIVITDGVSEASWSYIYNQSVTTLYIYPEPYLDGLKQYTATISKGLKGKDGSDLQNEYVWAFDTKEYPAGSVVIGGNGYTNVTGITLNLTYNGIVTHYRANLVEANLPATPWEVATASDPFTLAGVEGTETVYVQFRDISDNVSSTEFDTIVYDITAPAVDAGANVVARSSKWIYPSVTDTSGIETYLWEMTAGPGTVLFSYPASLNTTVYGASSGGTDDGVYTVQLTATDRAGNSASDTLSFTWDTVPPVVSSFTLNGGASATPSSICIIGVSASDALTSVTEVEHYYNGSYSGWKPYSTSFPCQFPFTATPGSKLVYIHVRDEAGNATGWQSQSITLQVPTNVYAYKGAYTTSTRVYFTWVSQPSTWYYVYSTTDADADPNAGAPVTYHGSTNTATYLAFTITPGELRYFFVRAYNSATGGWGPFTTTSVPGFASVVTVIYDDDEPADVTRAQDIKNVLTSNLTSHAQISGTMPSFTVTLLPEDLVSNSAYNTQNIIYGDPIILTHGTTFTWSGTTYDNRARHIAASGRSIVGMGTGGTSMLSRIKANFGAWGLSGQAPSEIGFGNSAVDSTVNHARVWKPSSPALVYQPWYASLKSTGIIYSHRANHLIDYSGMYEVAIYSIDHLVAGGELYAERYETSATNYFPVARQGRFAHWGFGDVPDDMIRGQVFYVNLIDIMRDYF